MAIPVVLRNAGAVVAGAFAGGILNMGLVALGPMVIPPPQGGDVSTMEGLRSTIHLFEPKHFLFPFLAHALGTLAGAWLAARLSATRPRASAMAIGLLFLAGGAMMAYSLPEAVVFNVVDLVLAYLPMAWLGYRWSGRS
jgi:hypothetical protein